MNFLENLSPVWQALFASLYTCFMTAAGASVIFFSDKPKKGFSVIAESSAAGIMLAASFFSLLSPAFDYPCAVPPYVAVTLGFCIGGAFIVLTDRLLSRSEKRAENGGKKRPFIYRGDFAQYSGRHGGRRGFRPAAVSSRRPCWLSESAYRISPKGFASPVLCAHAE